MTRNQGWVGRFNPLFTPILWNPSRFCCSEPQIWAETLHVLLCWVCLKMGKSPKRLVFFWCPFKTNHTQMGGALLKQTKRKKPEGSSPNFSPRLLLDHLQHHRVHILRLVRGIQVHSLPSSGAPGNSEAGKKKITARFPWEFWKPYELTLSQPRKLKGTPKTGRTPEMPGATCF